MAATGGNEPGRRYVDVKALFMAKNPRIASRLPEMAYAFIARVAHERDINEILPSMEGLEGWRFAEAALEQLSIKVEVRCIERLPSNGRVTFCSNHPLGGADGLAMMRLAGKAYGPFLHTSNDLLLSIPQLAASIIPVNKHGTNTTIVRDLEAMYSSEKPVIMFPAGRTARFKGRTLCDFPWAKSFVKKSREHGRTIVPVHISGRNSALFYFIWRARTLLGIKPNLEMFLLVDELFKQRGSTITLTIGTPLPPEVFKRPRTDAEWAEALRLHVDRLGTDPDAILNPEEKPW
jgi:putative hemolysin